MHSLCRGVKQNADMNELPVSVSFLHLFPLSLLMALGSRKAFGSEAPDINPYFIVIFILCACHCLNKCMKAKVFLCAVSRLYRPVFEGANGKRRRVPVPFHYILLPPGRKQFELKRIFGLMFQVIRVSLQWDIHTQRPKPVSTISPSVLVPSWIVVNHVDVKFMSEFSF